MPNPNNFPRVLDGSPVMADEWYNPVAEAVTALQAATLSNEDGICNAGSAGTTVSASYANMAGTTSVNINKRYESSRLVATGLVSSYSTATSTVGDFAVLVAGTDYQFSSMSFNVANAQLFAGGFRYIPGLPAGLYTVQLRWKRSVGAGTVTTDGFSWYSLSVRECG